MTFKGIKHEVISVSVGLMKRQSVGGHGTLFRGVLLIILKVKRVSKTLDRRISSFIDGTQAHLAFIDTEVVVLGFGGNVDNVGRRSPLGEDLKAQK